MVKNIEVLIDLLSPSDAAQVGRLIYSHFGNTYPDEVFYDSDKLIQLIKKGYITSFVVKTTDGRIVGHMALKKPDDQNIYYAACSVVHKNYRQQGLMLRLRQYAFNYLNKIGNPGFYSEVITIHPYVQKTCLSVGGSETGFLVSRVLPTVRYHSMSQGEWLNVLMFFHPVQNYDSILLQSTKYHDVIVNILKNLGIRNITYLHRGKILENNVYYLRIEKGWGISDLLVENLVNFRDDKFFWQEQLQKLEQQPARAVYLNLSHPHINDWLEILWQHKYFFAGIIPYFFKTGSALVMQQATDLPYSKNNQFATSFGRQIYEWCMADRERVLSLS